MAVVLASNSATLVACIKGDKQKANRSIFLLLQEIWNLLPPFILQPIGLPRIVIEGCVRKSGSPDPHPL
ncbi:hypothetical protein DVH24_027910 [Malus domestica]|uniref:Uncharacterized protein n=1 Tax=Malus domestica TaxID=3750 RepID=A0A498HFC8_MALDO|nr:hypothetical protein DVH24_027910 [Malus domestica]